MLGQTATITQGYDDAGNRESFAIQVGASNGFTNTYTYNALNRVDWIQQTGPDVSGKSVDIDYDPAGRLGSIKRYADDVVGMLLVADAVYTFDDANRLTHLAYTDAASAVLADYDWQYDDANRVTQFISQTDGTATYGYDETDQITSATYDYQDDELQSYDANGNRTDTGYATDPNNRMSSDGVYQYLYDFEGNRVQRIENASGATTEYTWDHRNRLVKITELDSVGGSVMKTVEYTYDPLNRRVAKTVDDDGSGPDPAETTFFLHDGDRATRDGAGDSIVLQLDDSGDITNRYLQGAEIDQIFADENALAEVLWPLADNQGTIRDLATYDDANGITEIVNHITYDAFGQITGEENLAEPTADPADHIFAYTGREWDADADLYYYRARWYDPTPGRFLSEDLLGFHAGDVNLNRYVGNGPTNGTDPSGNETIDLIHALEPENVEKVLRKGFKGTLWVGTLNAPPGFGKADQAKCTAQIRIRVGSKVLEQAHEIPRKWAHQLYKDAEALGKGQRAHDAIRYSKLREYVANSKETIFKLKKKQGWHPTPLTGLLAWLP